MDHILGKLAVCAALAAVFYLLWVNGWLVASRKRAAFFTLSRGKNACKVRCSACTGTVRRVIRLRADRGYTFVFDCGIKMGTVTAEIRDHRGRIVLRLDESTPKGAVTAGRYGRYCLVLRFEKADGACGLTWN